MLALVLGAGVACGTGLVLGQLGVFHATPVALAGIAAGVLGWLARGDRARETGGWHAVDGLAVLVAALALYAPAYDTTLYGADATAYLGTGAYLAQHGTFRIDAPLLRELPPDVPPMLFPSYSLREADVHMRSAAGLAYDTRGDGFVYSNFAKLPSVWMAIGYGVGGIVGALGTAPFFGALGVAAYYLFLRRTLGMAVALLAGALLATTLPQLVFARVSTAEIGAQAFFWGGVLALARYAETRRVMAAVTAGVALGCATLARAEFLLFVPLAAVIAWVVGPRLRVPAVALAVWVVLAAYAAILLALLPSHYWAALAALLAGTDVARSISSRPWLMAGALLALIALVVWGALRLGRHARGGAGGRLARGGAAALVAVWAFLFAVQGEDPAFAGARLLPAYASWLVLAAGVPGLVLLARRWWAGEATRFAFLVGIVAAGHFLYAPHAILLPLWAGRRLVPAALPVLFAGAAVGVASLARFGRTIVALAAVLTLGSNVVLGRALWGRPFLRGTHEAVAAVAESIPADAVVLLDPAFFEALLDVPLSLIHGREAVQLAGVAGDIRLVPGLAWMIGNGSHRPLYLVRHGLLGAPSANGVRFTQVAQGAYPIVPLDAVAQNRATLLAVRVYRVEWLLGEFRPPPESPAS